MSTSVTNIKPGRPFGTTNSKVASPRFRANAGQKDVQALVTFTWAGPSGSLMIYENQLKCFDLTTANTMIAEGLVKSWP